MRLSGTQSRISRFYWLTPRLVQENNRQNCRLYITSSVILRYTFDRDFFCLRGCPCKNRPLDFRPKTEFLQIFRVRQLVHKISKNGNNLAFNAIFQYFW